MLCDNSMQCKSSKCTQYISKPNVCYDCVADQIDNSTTKGAELTTYCNGADQYCSLTDFTCTSKVSAGETCQSNNYMCSSQLCDTTTDKCVDCVKDTDCANEGYVCKNKTCVFQLLQDGQTCTADSFCLSGNCSNGFCQGNATNGTECHLKYECESVVCDYQTCGGPVYHNDSDQNQTQPVITPIKPVDPTSTGPNMNKILYLLIFAIVAIVALVLLILCCKKKKNENNVFAEETKPMVNIGTSEVFERGTSTGERI